ncbi:hypothetical protein [Gracilimonas sp.]|uniref:hypothetical protein n=1 Tax=Gracilimonas sp. TaxID=1974203 RepID=UPI0032EC1B6E
MNKKDNEGFKANIPFYPKVSKKAFSINPDGYSSKGDELIFGMYSDSVKKNGFTATFNELKKFIKETAKEREDSLEKIIHHEKWFKNGIEFIKEFQPYREKDDKDEQKVNELNKSYPRINFEDFLEQYESWSSFQLASLIHYVDENMDYFKQVTFAKLERDGKDLREAIIHFDKINYLNERTKDLTELILQEGLDKKIEEDRFVQKEVQIKQEEQERKEQQEQVDKGGRPEKVSDEYIESFIVDWVQKAKEGHDDYKRLIWNSPKKKGKIKYARIVQLLINSSEVEKINKDTYKDDTVLARKVSSLLEKNDLT